MRTKAERRHKDFSKAIRKKNICEKHYGFPWYDNLHQYSKNKIHCSCPLCASKTNGRKRHDKRKCLTHSDKRKCDAMDYQIKEFDESEEE